MLFHLYAFLRWARLTLRRYGASAFFTSFRPRHAACGRGVRDTIWCSAHGASTGYQTMAMDLVNTLRQQRGDGEYVRFGKPYASAA